MCILYSQAFHGTAVEDVHLQFLMSYSTMSSVAASQALDGCQIDLTRLKRSGNHNVAIVAGLYRDYVSLILCWVKTRALKQMLGRCVVSANLDFGGAQGLSDHMIVPPYFPL